MIHVTVCPPAPLAPGEVSEERVWVYPTLDRRRKAIDLANKWKERL